jgi:methyl-accepting chemotaxis protein
MTPVQQKTERNGTEARTAHDEIHRLAEAMMNGLLDVRGNPDQFEGEDAKLIALVNRMLDTLVTPLRLAANAIAQISHGTIPPFVIDDFQGEYNNLKRNLNILLATLYGMHNETQNLINNINEGKLRTRGNDWDFGGIWRDLISGVNGTLDAVIDPVSEASTVLSRLANYDLRARMHGRYRGEHAVIKRAMNGTAQSLQSAIAQVADSVGSVTEVGNRIARSSQTVEKGATEQDRQISEASKNLSHISESSLKTAQNTANAQSNAQNSVKSITASKEAMERMLAAMLEIRSAADNTVTIVQEIDTIAKETESLSSSAAGKALKIRSSAGGFGVVASEIRKLSTRSRDAAKRLDQFGERFHTESREDGVETIERMKKEFDTIIKDLNNVALVSHYLGLNAATEAAHVEVAGDSFEGLTEEIRQLAMRSTNAAKRTEELIKCSVDFARKGEALSQEIDDQLAVAVEGGNTISVLTDEITLGSQEQARGLDEISNAVAQINEVTRQNAESARESSAAAKVLEQETRKLSLIVNKFQISDSAEHGTTAP